MWFSVLRSPGCIAPDVHLPLRNLKGWEEGGGTSAMPSPAGSQNGTSTETERWWKTNMGTFNLSLAKAMLPLPWISALTLLNLTYFLSFSLRLESTTMMAIYSLLVGAPESPGCSLSLMLRLKHLVAQEHTQLNKTCSCSGLSEVGETFPNPAPQQPSEHRSRACSETVPWCRTALLGGNRSVFHTVFKEDRELLCTVDYCWEVLWEVQWA